MSRLRLALLPVLFLTTLPLVAQPDWRTDFERSDSLRSPRYAETMAYLHRLAAASPWLRVSSFGTTPQGRSLPLVICARDGEFTPAAARRSGKDIILIQAGIHAGEIDGKDAGMMLLRDIAVTRSKADLARHAIILFMPMFNADGHERRSRWNRINQNGPEETGWRVTAHNLNLNRDYLKADTPEMRAWLRIFDAWQPDMLIDCHVTDGVDFRYNISFSTEMYANCPPEIVAWQRGLLDDFIPAMAAMGDPVVPYVFPREGHDVRSGLLAYAASPRFSTGYAALRGRASLLIETHMLKPCAARVRATLRLLERVLLHVNARPGSLRAAVRQAERCETAAFARADERPEIPVAFRTASDSSMITFLGYEMRMQQGPVSGAPYPIWDHARPIDVRIPSFDRVEPSVKIRAPRCYLVPQEWTACLEVLRLHGVRIARLAEDQRVPVEAMHFENPKWRSSPYEGRFTVQARTTVRPDTVLFPAGTCVVFLAQPSGRAALHLLEPDAPDSFLQWGFFNAIFERKEYFEEYVMEPLAEDMLRADPALRAAFETRLAADSAFAASPYSRLQFFYDRSPYADRGLNRCPVARCMDDRALRTVPESAWKRTPDRRSRAPRD